VAWRPASIWGRREWFETSDVATSVCWWIAAGEIPDLADAHGRLLQLSEHRPTEVGRLVNDPIPQVVWP
jgi:hypothetical protein